jgi:glycosyltransferase involved in cell wall biosynthesis
VKVLLLADTLVNGGLERQLALLATSLPPDWEARVWAMDGGTFVGYLRDRDVEVTVRQRRFRFDPAPAGALLTVLRSWRPDVVHVWSWMAGLAAAPLCRALGIPLVNGMIRSGAVDPDFPRLKRLGLAGATLVLANTRAGLRSWGVSSVRGRVVYNGFDQTRLALLDPERRPDPGCCTVIMTGRMTPIKHYDVVLDAARRLSRDAVGWRFVLVGDGPDRERLRRAAHDLVEGGVVAFPEPGTAVLDLARDADVGVLMTNPALANEGFSNSIMEYMALGLPVVCGDGGGNPELVRHGVTGFIVPPADPAALAERLAYLRARPDERRAMGAAGRRVIVAELSVEAMVGQTLAVYAEAARRAAPPGPAWAALTRASRSATPLPTSPD